MPRILITEDDKFMANICRLKLEEQGYEVVVAHDGGAALEILKNRPPDLVVLDLLLPVMDGIELLKFMRSEDALRRLPVIVMSNSSCFSGIAQSAWKAGATNFLNKADNTPHDLVKEVGKFLDRPAPVVAPPVYRDPIPQGLTLKPVGPYILVADDDSIIHNVLTFFIEQAGYDVRSAFDGRRALEIASAETPALMILDGMMPGLDGIEVLQHWTRHERLSKVPVIMLTGRKEAGISAAVLEAGAVEVLHKPFSPDAVIAMIESHVARAAAMAVA